MNDPNANSSDVAKSWDSYWRDTGDIGAYSMRGANHPAILAFWNDFFQTVKANYPAPKMIDIASGNGAVLEGAMAVFGDRPADFTCVDVSAAAIANIRNRFTRVRCMVADACSIPLESEAFDIVTSQFGVEYAGPDAINEATRLLASGGRLALVLHNTASSIHQECTASLDAILRLQESRFIPLAIELFRTGFEACRGSDRAPYEAAATQLAPAVQALESIMLQYGEHVAGDTIARLHSDVDRIHRNMQRHDPAEILDWLNRMDGELEAYAGRMSSMRAAAIDSEAFGRICTTFRSGAYTSLRAEALSPPEQDVPLAWVLVVTKSKRGHATAADLKEPQRGESPEMHARHEAEPLQAWTKQQIEAAISEMTKKQILGNLLVEAKPAWVLPFQIVIGKVRELGQSKTFDWFICGEVPTDQINGEAARTPREAARYFALKWQRDAARQQDLVDQKAPGPEADSRGAGGQLAEQAEALYALVDDPRVWPQQNRD